MRSRIEDLNHKRTLMCASTGGHLNQLVKLAPRLGVTEDSIWFTFDTPQSRSLLDGRETYFVDYVHPRDIRGIIAAARRARPLLDQVDAAVSTGAGLALSVLPQAGLMGKPSIYLESISRVLGPSVSGRILARTPRVGVYAQHHNWLYGPWRPGPAVLDSYDVESLQEPLKPGRLLVSLGTIKPYRFDRLIDAVLGYLEKAPDTEVLWQVGATVGRDLPGRVESQLSSEEFQRAIEWADAVVTHAGVGIAMNVLDAGKPPILMPRQAVHAEHVDDHQSQIHSYLINRGLGFDAEKTLGDPAMVAGITARRVVRERLDLSRP